MKKFGYKLEIYFKMGSNNNKMNNGNLSDIIHSNSYQNIKSKYILKQILENLHKKRLMILKNIMK